MFIREFSFSNFYSFREEQTVRFGVGAHAPDTTAYVTTASGDRFTKVLGVFGANASGKTNLLRVLDFVRRFIVESFHFDTEAGPPFEPFKGNYAQESTNIEVVFESGGLIYRYVLEAETFIHGLRVLREDLYRRDDVEGARFAYVFKRELNKTTYKYNVKVKGLELPSGFANTLRDSASLISAGAQYDIPVLAQIKRAWACCVSNRFEDSHFESPQDFTTAAAKTYLADEELFKRANDLLASLDLGLSRFAIEEFELNRTFGGRAERSYLISGIHRAKNGGEFEIPFHLESGGVRKLFNHLSLLLQTLRDGGIVLMDEMESELHPYLIEAIIGLFESEQANPAGGQLLFSCHYAPIMRLLDKYQVILVEKDDRGESELWRLDEMQGLRADDNYYTRYITGAYGAIPDIQVW